MSDRFKDVSKFLNPGEDVIGMYDTVYHKTMGHTESISGILAITTQRVLFFRRAPVIKKIVKSLVKGDAESWEIMYSLKLEFVNVKAGGITNKFLSINGERHHLQGISIKDALDTIQAAAERARSAPKQAQQPSTNAPAPASQPARLFCSKCGKENATDARFCNGCGAEM